IVRVIQKFTPDPNQVLLRLPVERDTRPDPGMGEEIITGAIGKLERPVKAQVIVREQAAKECCSLQETFVSQPDGIVDRSGVNTIGHQRCLAAIMEPIQPRNWLIKKGQEKVLMVSFQKDCAGLLWQPAG